MTQSKPPEAVPGPIIWACAICLTMFILTMCVGLLKSSGVIS